MLKPFTAPAARASSVFITPPRARPLPPGLVARAATCDVPDQDDDSPGQPPAPTPSPATAARASGFRVPPRARPPGHVTPAAGPKQQPTPPPGSNADAAAGPEQPTPPPPGSTAAAAKEPTTVVHTVAREVEVAVHTVTPEQLARRQRCLDSVMQAHGCVLATCPVRAPDPGVGSVRIFDKLFHAWKDDLNTAFGVPAPGSAAELAESESEFKHKCFRPDPEGPLLGVCRGMYLKSLFRCQRSASVCRQCHHPEHFVDRERPPCRRGKTAGKQHLAARPVHACLIVASVDRQQ